MRKLLLSIMLSSCSVIGFCQYDSTYAVQEIYKENNELACYFGEPEDIGDKAPTYSDSLVHCKTFKLFKTDKKDLYYMKYFDQEGRIFSEGPVLIESYRPKFYKRKSEAYPQVGLWKEYKYARNEVVYVDCYYEANPDCRAIIMVERKREKIKN